MASDLARHWTIDPEIEFLNHGSFGACPSVVQEHQRDLQAELERDPMAFLAGTLEGRLAAARSALADFVGAQQSDLAFVSNASTGVNTVLRSLSFEPGDELLTTSMAYNAVWTAMEFVADRSGAELVRVDVPFPLESSDQVLDAVLGAVTAKTKLAVLDHVTSTTGLVLPIERLVRGLSERGVDVLVDGAHAPGMLDLEVDALGAAYYTGNCHKWLCSPKGAAFLHVRRDRQDRVRPLVISHGANVPRTDRSRFQLEMDWTGTDDPTAYLSVARAIEVMAGLVPGGWSEVRRRNRALALAGREVLCRALEIDAPAPEDMIGSLASVPLPRHALLPGAFSHPTPLQAKLRSDHATVAQVFPWPAPPDYVVRISPQLYNDLAQFERLAALLKDLLR